jgi:hypothetical protein
MSTKAASAQSKIFLLPPKMAEQHAYNPIRFFLKKWIHFCTDGVKSAASGLRGADVLDTEIRLAKLARMRR